MSKKQKIKRRPIIDSFSYEYCFLSNFYQTSIYYHKRFWTSVEHAFQASKTLDFEEQEAIRHCQTCKLAKQFGRTIKLRSNWERVKLDIMFEIIYRKFYDNQWEMQRLIDTRGKRLVEGNIWHDNFWGHCMCPKCQPKYKHNHLGRTLMKVRREITRIAPVWIVDRVTSIKNLKRK